MFQRFVAKIEEFCGIQLASKKTILGLIELQEMIEIHFLQLRLKTIVVRPDVGQNSLMFLYGTNQDFDAVLTFDAIAFDESDPSQGSVFRGIHPPVAGGNVKYGDPITLYRDNDPKAQFRFSLTNPALTRDK